MRDRNAANAARSDGASFGVIAVRGSFINTAQWFVNKFATAVAMLIIARFLVPEDYGVANQALAIAQFMVVFFPLTMGDVLIAHPREFETLVPTARRLSLLIGAFTGLVMLLSIPIFVRIYSAYPSVWLGSLIAVAALRPLLDAALMIPLARMRIGLRYRRIALIDGVVQIGATGASLLMAIFGFRGAALVAPQVVGTGARVVWYRRAAPSRVVGRFDRSAAGMLMRAYLPAASAQYLHNVIVMLEVLVLGFVAGDYQTGLFAFAFQVAAQANTVVAYQLGVVLQPILGHLREDPARQVAGFLRAQRVLGLVCVPLSLAQALVAEPLFRIAFPEKYAPAIPVFQILSLAQAFYFASGPSMSCLRSQRRFRTFLAWQAAQFIVALPLYWVAASSAKDHGALAVALASAVSWAVSTPVVVWLCTRVAPGRHTLAAIMVFIKPWFVSLPVFAVAWAGVRLLQAWGRSGDWVSLVVIGPVATLVALFMARTCDTEMRSISEKFIQAAQRRLRGNRT